MTNTRSGLDQSETLKCLSISEDTIWLGALSFEPRCVASILDVAGRRLKVGRGLLLDYTTEIHPLQEAEARRRAHKQLISNQEAITFRHGIQIRKVDPYSFQDIQDLLSEVASSSNIAALILDVTCLTKIQTLAAAALLAQPSFRQIEVVVAYTVPETYQNLDTAALGWKDIIIAPFAETGLLQHERHSRGILIPGHEAQRLAVALAEIEPAGGSILISRTRGRPDLASLCRRKNRKTLSLLKQARSTGWRSIDVDLDHLHRLEGLIAEEVRIAKANSAPLFLFPYGPKPLIFISALEMCRQYFDASWFVYPVPAGYDIDYTEGIGRTLWTGM